MTNTIPYTPGPWDCDLDYIVAPDPNGRHPDIYIAEIAMLMMKGALRPMSSSTLTGS